MDTTDQTQTPVPARREVIDEVAYEMYITGDTARFRIVDVPTGEVLPAIILGPVAVVEAYYEKAIRFAAA